MSIQSSNFLGSIGAAGLLGLASPREQQAQEQAARAHRGRAPRPRPREQKAQEQAARATRCMPIPKIKDIGVIECQPAGVRLTVVKITTDQDGVYGGSEDNTSEL